MQNVVLAGEPLSEPGSVHITKVPLRRKPHKRTTLEYLASLTPDAFGRNYFTGPTWQRRGRISLRGQQWKNRKPSPWLRPALSSLIAWMLFCILFPPYGALVIVGATISVWLAINLIDRVSDTVDVPAAQFVRLLRAAFFVSSWGSTSVRAPAVGLLRIFLGLILLAVIIVSMAVFFSSGKRTAEEQHTGMAYVPGGEFLMGSTTGDQFETPAHTITVKPFFMDLTEVTCEAYDKFVKATGHRQPASWVNGTYPPGSEQRPVTGVDWYDAASYAQWIKKRLPTEEEWEFAARGTDGRRYPWGNEWRANSANTAESGLRQVVDVGSYPNGKSPYGLLDMTGNAWEWTASDLKAYPGGQLPPYRPGLGEYKIFRGGSWRENKNEATATYRGYWAASGADDYSATGFRCVADVDSAAGNNPQR
jgi:formylglycine-generating enzyme required for sulfatase activity